LITISNFVMSDGGVKSVFEILSWINDQHTIAHLVLYLFGHVAPELFPLLISLSKQVNYDTLLVRL